jgi:hypothetical protein
MSLMRRRLLSSLLVLLLLAALAAVAFAPLRRAPQRTPPVTPTGLTRSGQVVDRPSHSGVGLPVEARPLCRQPESCSP